MAAHNSATVAIRVGRWVLSDESAGTKLEDHPNEIQITESSEPVERHPEFFFDNTLIAIQIGKTLFNVHKYQLAKSEVFSDMFKLPKPGGNTPEEGSSPEYPIKLEGVAASDFVALLRVLYASHFSSNHPAPEAPLVVPAFRLANLFGFSELRAYLLPLAEKNLDAVEKVLFSREFGIKEWLVPALTHLCERESPLSSEEARKLGAESILMIMRIREQHRTRPSTGPFTVDQYYCSPCTSTGFIGVGSQTHTCDKCGTRGPNYYRYGWPAEATHSSTAMADNATIEAGVKKWIEHGCTMKD